MAQKTNSQQMNPSKTTDANGWTVYDFGTWKEYRKIISFSNTVTANSAYVIGLANSNLPSGMSTLGSNYIQWALMQGSNAFALTPNFEGGSSNSVLNFTAYAHQSGTFSGSMYVSIVGG